MSPPAPPANRPLPRAARTRIKVRVANATPDVAQLLRDLGLAWMLEARPLPRLAPANEPMRGVAA